VSPGESPEQAIRREAREELAIDLDGPAEADGLPHLERLEPYIYRDEIETEYVVPYRLAYSGALRPNPEEVEEGAFFDMNEIRRRLREEPQRFTPHFRLAFVTLLVAG